MPTARSRPIVAQPSRAGWQAIPRMPRASRPGAHRLYIAEVRHPIEVTANENHLLPWLSRRVGTNLRAPDLSTFGLRLLGGRLLPGMNGPAALFMYEGLTGERITFYASRQQEP